MVLIASRAIGNAGTMEIHDDGSLITMRIRSSDGSTFSGGIPYRVYVDGAWHPSPSGWWYVGYPSGSPWVTVWSDHRHAAQWVEFAIGDTGTWGFGDGYRALGAGIVRPLPNAPTDLVVTRVSDAQHTLNWNRNSTYTSVVVQRRANDGSWQQVGVASGDAFTFTDTTTGANSKYTYRVAGVAASGQSAWSDPATVYTTPAAPTGVSAARSGDDIVVTASGVPPWATVFDIEDDSSVIASAVSLPFVHVAPNPAVPHQYRVRGVIGAVAGVWSGLSNVVQLISPPLAPAGLTPNGGVAPSDGDVLFKWTHNPVDSSPQSAYELRLRVPAGAWTTLTGTTSSQRAVALAVGAHEWQVRTKGAHPDWSVWSPVATFNVIDRPGVAILQPDGTWDSSILPLQWSWFQAQSRPQSAWQVELVNSLSAVVESRSGSGADTAVTFTTRLTEGDWTVRVRAATGDVWSVWASETFEVAFDPPAPPVLDGRWEETMGGVVLTVGSGTPGVAVLDGGAWFAEFVR